jgi:AraC-like DNA-binding protein
MSHSNFYRKIKALTGYTIIEFKRIVRLKQALRQMEPKKYKSIISGNKTGHEYLLRETQF